MSVELAPGCAVEVREVWAFGHPPAWSGGYKFRGRCVYPIAGELVVVEVTGGTLAGCFLNFDERNVRPFTVAGNARCAGCGRLLSTTPRPYCTRWEEHRRGV